jgi:formylglycine-generating enzyme required for sulfatase activity
VGDVWEWTATVEDGLPVVRGGCWNNRPHLERVAFRLRDDPDDRINNLGFRFAREVA